MSLNKSEVFLNFVSSFYFVKNQENIDSTGGINNGRYKRNTDEDM